MNSKPTNQPPEGMTPDNIEGYLNAFRDGYNAAMPPTVNPLPTIDEAGVIAVRISDKVNPELTAQEEALFVAGFQECIKYLATSAQPPTVVNPSGLQDHKKIITDLMKELESICSGYTGFTGDSLRSYEAAEKYLSTPPPQPLGIDVDELAKKYANHNSDGEGYVGYAERYWAFKAGYAASEGEELVIKFPEHNKIVLTNSKGDTYTSTSEGLIDFLFNCKRLKIASLSEGEEAIGFAEWIYHECWFMVSNNIWVRKNIDSMDISESITTQQLYNLYKQ